MARRKLSLEDQLKGVKAALRSRRTPPQLRGGLRRRAKELENKLGVVASGRKKDKQSDVLGIFGL
jgi:hypothetical protein